MPAAELLARAQATIEAADFVGFYETMDTDFWRLKEPEPNDLLPLAPWDDALTHGPTTHP
jgi:hypothetical protein